MTDAEVTELGVERYINRPLAETTWLLHSEGVNLSKETYDKTLVDEEILEWAKNSDWKEKGGIYENFEAGNARGETYDIRAGALIICSEADGKRNHISLEDQKEIAIEPFRSATVQSLEKIKLPLNMSSRLISNINFEA